MTHKIAARAPSNIALIKYMGKKNPALNVPANPSLSMTLDRLCSFAEIREASKQKEGVRWVSEAPDQSLLGDLALNAKPPKLSALGIAKIVSHYERVKSAAPKIFAQLGLELSTATAKASIEVRTANTFPSDSGIASSASSFAALTLAMCAFLAKDPSKFEALLGSDTALRRALAKLSRQASGSSCRSFEGPWVLWDQESAGAVIAPSMPRMVDLVVLIASEPKQVSSTEAHSLVETSPLWDGRAERARERIAFVEAALAEGDLHQLARTCWAEMWEMHSLFHTCQSPFTYWEPGSLQILKWVTPYIQEAISEGSELTPPIVTMDAGPNVHILVPEEEEQKWRRNLAQVFPHYQVLRDGQGSGAMLLLPSRQSPANESLANKSQE